MLIGLLYFAMFMSWSGRVGYVFMYGVISAYKAGADDLIHTHHVVYNILVCVVSPLMYS